MASTTHQKSSRLSSEEVQGGSVSATASSRAPDVTDRTMGYNPCTIQEQHPENEKEKEREEAAIKDDDDSNALTGAKLYSLCAAVVFSTLLMSLNGTILATAIPKITSQFNSLGDIGWYGSAYLISTCSMQPLVGKLYTHFPTKQTYIIFDIIFAMGSLICATSTSSNMLIGGRAVQGIGGAGVVNGAFASVTAAAPRDRKPLIVGIGIALSSIGTVLGPLIGGALTQHVSWHWCFYINLPPSALVIVILLILKIPEQTEKPPIRPNLKRIIKDELDILGFFLFAPTCIMFLLAIIWGGNKYRWDSSIIIGLFCGGGATLAVFIVWEIHRGDRAMIPPGIARRNLVMFGCFTSWFQMGSLVMFSYFMPIWFQVVKDATPTMSGVMVLPTALAQGVGAVLAGQFVRVIGYCTAWALFGCVLTSIGSGLMTTFTISSGAGSWIGYQILIGLGRGSVIQMPITAIQNLLPGKEVAIATSSVFFFQYLGGAVFLAVGQTIFAKSLRAGLHDYAPSVNPEEIINVGAYGVRSIVSDANIDGVVRAYNYAVTRTFYLAVGGTCAAFLTSFGMGWQRLPRKAKKKTEK